MGIYDKQTRFSNNQAITANAISENVIKVGPGDFGQGNDLFIDVFVTEAFNNLTSLEVDLRTDDDEAFGSHKVLYSTGAIVLADLVAGYKFTIRNIPPGCEDYLALYYTVVGTAPTTGKIFASMTDTTQEDELSY